MRRQTWPLRPPWALSPSHFSASPWASARAARPPAPSTGTFCSDRNQLLLYGFALLLTFLPTELGFLQQLLGLTSLTGNQWLTAIVLAFALLLVDEVIKIFLRRSRKQAA